MSRYSLFIHYAKKLALLILITTAIFTINRLVFMFRFGNFSHLVDKISEWPLLLFTGFRFDIMVISYLFALPFVLTLVLLALPYNFYEKAYQKITRFWMILFIPLITALLMADQEFYSFFQLHFDTVTFDFLNEKPLVLMRSIWQDHPVLLFIAAYAVATWATIKALRYLYKKDKKSPKVKHWFAQTLVIIATVFFYFLGMRSSLGTFPLQTKNSVISSDDFINKCVPNGIYTLKEALKEITNEFASDTPGGLLHAYGYKNIREVIADYYEIPIDSLKSQNLDSLIFKKSQGTCLQQNEQPPHIVWLIMESMSNHFLEFHSSQINLLGKLEPHWKEGIVFRNFQSSGNGTVTALENTIFNTPYHILFESRYRHRNYPTSVALPFKQAGYNTAFITGIELGWRHMNEVLPEQGFDDCAGRATILNELPGAEANETWGVFDHHMFRFIEQKLKKSSTPQFVLSLSSTNHTPFELPDDYKPFPLVLSDSVENAFTTPKERSEEILRGYQYANSSIGSFLEQLKADSLWNNTIVIVTGDHNVRSLLPYNTPENAPFKFQVPLFMHIPDKYKQQLHIDTERYGSHYDILTSIAPYFLKGANYLNLGQDLFDAQTPTEKYYSINDARVQAPKEGLQRAKEKAKLRRIIQRYYFTKLFGIE